MEAFDDSDGGSQPSSGSGSDSDDDSEEGSAQEGSQRRDEDESEDESGDESDSDEHEENWEGVRQPKAVKNRVQTASMASVPLFERVRAQQEERINSAGAASSKSRSSEGGEKTMSARQRNRIKRQKEKEALGITNSKDGNGGEKWQDNRKGIVHRENKNRPSEMSSSRPVSRFRDVLVDPTVKRKRTVDPRFNDLAGELKEKTFHSNYQFLDGYQEDEINKLEKAYKKVKSSDTKDVLKQELSDRKQQMKDRRRKLAVQERMADLKKQEKSKVAAGKKPFFLKEAAKKAIVVEEKYKELKQSGQLKSYMQKKRQKNAQKDKRWMPESRAGED